jgi:hypothetical protein
LKQKIQNERFRIELIEANKAYGRGFITFLHQSTGLSTGFISLVIRGKKETTLKNQIALLSACDIDYQFLIDENQCKNSTILKNKTHVENQINLKCLKSIQKFQNKPLAYQTIDKLLELESIDQMAFAEIAAEINNKVNTTKTTQRIQAFESQQDKSHAPKEKSLGGHIGAKLAK